MFMVGAHLGHDVRVGNDCTLVNGALVAGHCVLHDGCILSGHSAVQQRVRIGRLAMLGGLGSTTKDIPPFVLQQGYNCVTGLNIVGLRRAGFSTEAIAALREAFRILYKEGRTQNTALDRIEADLGHDPRGERIHHLHPRDNAGNQSRTLGRAPAADILTAVGRAGTKRKITSILSC